jgi:hypothetical protein
VQKVIALLLLILGGVASLQAKEPAALMGELYTGPEFQRAFNNPEDHPNLPNVLLIGDSISIGYTVDVRKRLAGKADVFRIPTNGRNAAYGLKHLDGWLKGRTWNVIHFNWGLWDFCYRNPDSENQGNRDKINGKLTATPEEYGKTLEQIVDKLLETKARLIWCATTPVPEGEAGRFQGDEIKYNQVAEAIMKKHGIPIDDLHAHALLRLPGTMKNPGDVHYTAEGYSYLAERVADEILKQLITTVVCAEAMAVETVSPLQLECLGVAAKRENSHVWGSSPIMDPDGKVHIYAAQWKRPGKGGFGGKTKDGEKTGWTSSSQIAHYVGDKPEGPFEFVRIAVPDKDGEFNAPHNPTIKYIDGKYVLLFIVNSGGPDSQRIMMYVADDLNDHWRPAAGAEPDGTLLRKSTDTNIWDHTAMLGNANPCLIKHDGKYKLYFKAVIPVLDTFESKGRLKDRTWTYGVALSNTLEGPYIKEPERITETYHPVEDACVFTHENRVWMLTRDMNEVRGGGGLLWVSDDGMEFDYEKAVLGFHHLDHYIGKEEAAKLKNYRGSKEGHLERPQVLFIDGKPAYLYMATGLGLPEPYGSCSYVFKMTPNSK